MTRYVIDPEAGLHLAQTRAVVREGVQLLAPTLFRSQVLARLYAQVQAGEMAQREAEARLDYLRGLRLRLLGDRVLQAHAWSIAAKLDQPETYAAEYMALTRLQADALAAGDMALADVARAVVPVAEVADLLVR